MQSIGQTVAQRLESVTSALRDGVTNSAQIASQGQTAIATELKNTREQIGLIQKQIGEVQEQSRGLSQATQSLEQVLGGAKTRGLLGEVTLQRLLEDSLPASQFAMQYRFTSGESGGRGDFSARRETDGDRLEVSAGGVPSYCHGRRRCPTRFCQCREGARGLDR